MLANTLQETDTLWLKIQNVLFYCHLRPDTVQLHLFTFLDNIKNIIYHLKW